MPFTFSYPVRAGLIEILNTWMKELPSKLVALKNWDFLPSFNIGIFIFLPENILNVLEQGEILKYDHS